VAHRAAGVIPVKVNRQKECQPVSSYAHGSPVTQAADTTIKRTIKVSLTRQATRRAGEDDIGDLSLRNNEKGLFSRTVALPYPPRECLE